MLAQTYYSRDPRVRRATRALVSDGYLVDVLSLREHQGSSSRAMDGASVYELPLTRRRGNVVRYLFEYAAFFVMATTVLTLRHIRRRYALIYVHTHPDGLVFAALPARLMGARVLLDVHDPMPETIVSRFGWPPRHWAVRLSAAVEQVAIGFADCVITVHEPLRDLLLHRRGRRRRDIAIVMNLSDLPTRRLPASPKEGQAPLVVYAGTLAHAYGVDVAIEAVAAARSRVPDLKMLIVGEGPDQPRLLDLCAGLGLEHVVTFRPPVAHQDIPAILAAATIGISSHRDDELYRLSLSNKVYEYVAHGLPTVVSDTDAVRRYYPPDTVCLVTPGDVAGFADAIVQIASCVELQRRLSERGLMLTSRWNWDRERSRLLACVRSTIGPSG